MRLAGTPSSAHSKGHALFLSGEEGVPELRRQGRPEEKKRRRRVVLVKPSRDTQYCHPKKALRGF